MTEYAMPFLMINLGGEMLYILSNRLKAQGVEIRREEQIMNDLTVNMFTSSFLDELFRPQPLYTTGATLNVFASLAETSVMKLSSNSIRKMFDLMRMVVKRQLESLAHPLEIIEWTMNHIEGVMEIIPQQAQPTMHLVRDRVLALHRRLNLGDYAVIRRTLLNFTLGFRVKVSVMLDHHLQNSDGVFLFPPPQYIVPLPSCEPPGVITYFKEGKAVQQTRFPHRDASLKYPAPVRQGEWDCVSRRTRVTSAGRNHFASVDLFQSHTQDGLPRQNVENPFFDSQQLRDTGYEREMNLLSQIAGSQRTAPTEKFQLQLFGNEAEYAPPPRPTPVAATTAAVPSTPERAAPPPVKEASTPPPPVSTAPPPRSYAAVQPPPPAVVKTEGEALLQQNRDLLGIAKGLDQPTGKSNKVDDLLDLMDQI